MMVNFCVVKMTKPDGTDDADADVQILNKFTTTGISKIYSL